MWKTIAAVGVTAVVIGGAGTAAFAATGTPTPAPALSSDSSATTPATPTTAAGPTSATRRHPGRDRIRRAVHATWVTGTKKSGTFTTHDAIRGQVSAVSPTSITVTAADKVSETFVVNPGTKVWTRVTRTAAQKAARPRTGAVRAAASISDVKPGDSVFVGGTGTTTLTAIRVIDITG